ncbi:glycosyltransferase [Halomicrococcus sp. NG-SE-24]|uniref:glycosyltransferase n=1 Tax=Halomicrococcus sp. NG-SE-24 TaxID=3436928 RepID=UPI003D982EBE
MLYQHNITRPDLYVANSDLVARRIQQYWNIPDDQIRVVYPPVSTYEYSSHDAETGDYFVTVSRLDGPKCIDEIVHAFNQTEFELRIAGRGPERDRLEELAEENIHFEGYVSEDQKQELLSGARAFVFASQNEDFGMAPVEAMAAGTPVIGVKDGFTQDQIIDGKNGITYARNGSDLRERLHYFDRHGVDWTSTEIATFAEDHFSVQRFRDGIQRAVEEAQERSRVIPDWQTDADTSRDIPPETIEQATPDGGEYFK